MMWVPVKREAHESHIEAESAADFLAAGVRGGMQAITGGPLAPIPVESVSPAVLRPEHRKYLDAKAERDAVSAPAMPCVASGNSSYKSGLHQGKIPKIPFPFPACVARPVDRKERNATPDALEAINKEWARLRSIEHDTGVGCWDESKVREWREVRHEALKAGRKIHVGRIFDICVEKGSEMDKFLPDGTRNPDRKFKGRAVFQGNNVHDENFEVAMFQELSSSPATMEASKSADMYGLLQGHCCEQADAESAYTQCKLGGVKTWVRLPYEQWPQEWKDAGYHDPVCPLILPLYGHPDSGGYWDCLLYTSPSPRDLSTSRMPSSA